MTDGRRGAVVVRPMHRDEADAVAAVLADAFHDYPVMRHTLGDSPDYAHRLGELVRFFVTARVLRGEPMLGAFADGELSAAALCSYPEDTESPPALALLRERVWTVVGADARARYDALGAAWRGFAIEAPHLHLNMIGVRRDRQRRGLGRALLGEVHRLAAARPGSQGVSLTTEDPVNVALYEHLGYRIIGRQTLAAGLETWGMWRPVTPPAAPPPAG